MYLPKQLQENVQKRSKKADFERFFVVISSMAEPHTKPNIFSDARCRDTSNKNGHAAYNSPGAEQTVLTQKAPRKKRQNC